MERRPTRGEMVTTNTHYRKPRYNSKGEADDPGDELLEGGMFVALGTAALVFAGRSMNRVRLEKTIIGKMWAQGTTVSDLKRMATAGTSLPDVVLVKGTLTARGPKVPSLASKVTELRPLMGSVEQQSNFFMGLSDKILSGEVRVPKGIKVDDVESVDDTFSRRQAHLHDNLIVSELFLTRLGCEAKKVVTEDKNGNRRVNITRKPRKARFNVLHHRQVAEGLELADSNGDRTGIVLEDFGSANMRANESPSLFLSLPDALNEFKKHFEFIPISNADKPLSHLSKFLHLDRQSKTDMGAFPCSGSPTTALDELGHLVPHGWLWSGHGFYDNNPGHWSTYRGVEEVDYQEFKWRMQKAAEENAMSQDATKMSSHEMRQARSEENCFRISELGIPNNSDVVVLGKPQLTLGGDSKENDLIIGPPEKPASWANVDDPRFNFRILKGHTIDNLMKHRKAALQVYLGLAVMGVCTIEFGEQLIRDSLVVVA